MEVESLMSTLVPAKAQSERSKARPGRRVWLGVWTLSVGTFTMATVEGLPVGVLPSMSTDLHVSQGLAGLSVTMPGLMAALTAPLLPMVSRTLDRRSVLLALLSLLVVANVLTATATSFLVLLAARLAVGVCIGGFWSLAAVVAVRLVPDQDIPRALSITFTGATAASVIGVPAGALIGSITTWREAFLTAGALAVVVAVAVAVFLPKLPPAKPIGPRTIRAQWAKPGVRGAATATLLLVGGHYVAYTFVSPALEDIAGVDQRWIGALLLAFGVAAVFGTLVVGSAVSRSLRGTIVGLSVLFAAVLATFPWIASTTPLAALLLMLWGLAFGGVPVAVQTWIVRAAGSEVEAATALNTTAYNLAIAAGAFTGGLIVDATSVSAVLWTAATLVGAASLVAGIAGRNR
jgi:predicted MFS family arabinose efflux permease